MDQNICVIVHRKIGIFRIIIIIITLEKEYKA